jgi:hypothetical protein
MPSINDSDFDPKGKDRQAMETYITARYDLYKDVYDKSLWAIFRSDFKKWDLKDF